MLHGYEEASIIPAIDLFDSGMMQQAIAAAREQYQQSQAGLDNFYKTYGDFLSPSSKDTKYYYDNTTRRVADALNYAYANGIDLTRSAEGRAFIANITRNVPYATLAAMRQNAKDLDTYNKLVAEAKAKGTYVSDEAQAFLNGGFNPNNFSTIDENGNIVMVGNRAPYRIRSMNEATADFYKGRTPHELTKQQVVGMGYKYDPRYKYVGFDHDDLVKTAGSQTQGWMSTPEGKWYYELARRKVAAAGKDPNNEDLVQAQLNEDVAQANIRFEVQPTSQKDDYAYLRAQTAASDWLDRRKQERDVDTYRRQKAIDDEYDNRNPQPVSYSTLTNEGSRSNAAKRGNGVDISGALEGLRGRLNRMVPNATDLDRSRFNENFNKLSKKDQAEYGKVKAIYNKVADLASSDNAVRESALKWFRRRPNAFKYAFSPKGNTGQELTRNINRIFGTFEYPLEGGLAQTGNRILGKGEKMKSPWKGKYQKIDLKKGSGVRFAPIAKSNALAGTLYSPGSDQRKFDELLQNVVKEGWLVDNAMSSATIGDKKYTSGIATIPYKKLFDGSGANGKGFKTFRNGDTTWTIDKLNKLGVTVTTSSGDPITDKAFYNLGRADQNNVVIKVPVVKTSDVDDVGLWQDTDSYYMSLVGGKGLSKQQLVNNQARALQEALQFQQ